MKNTNPIIHYIILNEQHGLSERDSQLVQQVAAIEQLTQPSDSWCQQTITDLLKQKVNHCWVILNGNRMDKNHDKNDDRNKAVSRDEVVAYCMFSKVFEVVDILRIGTHPDYQRNGLATGLLQTIIDNMASDNVDRIMLEVRADNAAAINLYQKLGFAEIHRRRNYYFAKANQTGAKTSIGTELETSKDRGSKMCDAIIMQYARLG